MGGGEKGATKRGALARVLNSVVCVERGTGFEPAATCLEGRSSTPELPPRAHQLSAQAAGPMKTGRLIG